MPIMQEALNKWLCLSPSFLLSLQSQPLVFWRAKIDFSRAAASIVNLLSVLFRSLWLSGRAQSLLNSNVSLPFLSVLTGRAGYSLGSLAGARSWKCWPEASVTGIGACRGGGSTTSGRAGGGAVAAAGTSPGPGLGIKAASGPGGALRQERHYPVWRRAQVIPVQIL